MLKREDTLPGLVTLSEDVVTQPTDTLVVIRTRGETKASRSDWLQEAFINP